MSFWAIKSGARHSAADLASINLAKSAIEEAKRSLEDAHAATRSLTEPVPTESGQASKSTPVAAKMTASAIKATGTIRPLDEMLANKSFVEAAKKANGFGLGRPATFAEQMIAIGGSRSVEQQRIDDINRSIDVEDVGTVVRIARAMDAGAR